MKSDTTKTSERRRIERAPARAQQLAEVGARSTRGVCGCDACACRMCSTWRRPLRAGIMLSTSLAVEERADPVAVAREQAREHRDEVGRHRCACAPGREPKSTDGLRSSRNQAVTSRSSWYSRTYGVCSAR